jgi:hypothetical protein
MNDKMTTVIDVKIEIQLTVKDYVMGLLITSYSDFDSAELKACEVETGIVKEFQSHSRMITCIDISANSTLLASGARDFTAQICLDTGKLVAGPFKSIGYMSVIQFSTDLKKLAIESWVGNWLEVWDVQSQMLDVKIDGKFKDTQMRQYSGQITTKIS